MGSHTSPAASAGSAPKSLDDELKLDFFEREGFVRRHCESCKKAFWTVDASLKRCGDNPCVEYSFIGSPITKRRFGIRELREDYLGFFEKRGHTRVAPFPVIARWRTDIYLTTASIADFQPHVTSGLVAPPFNPLTISQPCVRLTDLDSVGRSGRHLNAFEMLAHHAFNKEGEREVYWKERTVELCDEYMRQFGVAREAVTYKENPWFGGGNAGPALEVMAGGLEVATLVFMFLEEDPEGPIPLGGSSYREMPMRIVDTGYGLERFLWGSSGAPNIYQALFPEVVDLLLARSGLGTDLKDPHTLEVLSRHARFAGAMSVDTTAKVRELRARVAQSLQASGFKTSVEELERIMEPLESVFAVSEHARALAMLLTDGIVPSNVKAGYLARLLIRATLRHLESLKLDAPAELLDLTMRQLDRLRRERDLPDRRAYIERVLNLEAQRYAQTAEKGRRMVRQYLAKEGRKGVPLDTLIEFYNSHGIHPSVVREAAKAEGVEVEVPDAFLSIVAQQAGGEKQAKKRPRKFGVPATRQLYYTRQGPLSPEQFEAKVLWSKDGEVVLDETEFFADSGGQPADHGTLEAGGRVWKVIDVQKEGDAVVHRVEGAEGPAKGSTVVGRVDRVRRMGHAVHHTSTHITLAAAIQVLGPHVWQTGTQKAEGEARIDITHFDRLSIADAEAVERRANEIVLADLPVEALWLPRDEAEKLYGIRIFQGGVPEARMIRVVTIKDTDAECCGGTHLLRTGQVGSIHLKRVERVADGVERLVYSGALSAVEEGQRQRRLLEAAAAEFSVPRDDVPRASKRFFEEWKERGKEVERLQGDLMQARLKGGAPSQDVGGVKVVAELSARPPAELMAQAKEIGRGTGALGVFVTTEGGKGPQLIVSRSQDVAADCRAILQAAFAAVGGGRGGGKPDFAQGGAGPGADPQRLLDAARQAALSALQGR